MPSAENVSMKVEWGVVRVTYPVSKDTAGGIEIWNIKGGEECVGN